MLRCALASSPDVAGPSDRERALAALQLGDPSADGCRADPGHLGDRPYPAVAQQPRLGRQHQALLALVQMRQQHRKPRGKLITSLARNRHTRSTSAEPKRTPRFFTSPGQRLRPLLPGDHPHETGQTEQTEPASYPVGDALSQRSSVDAGDEPYQFHSQPLYAVCPISARHPRARLTALGVAR